MTVSLCPYSLPCLVTVVVVVILFACFETGSYVALAVLELHTQVRLVWDLQTSTCLCLQSSEIKGVPFHTQLDLSELGVRMFLKWPATKSPMTCLSASSPPLYQGLEFFFSTIMLSFDMGAVDLNSGPRDTKLMEPRMSRGITGLTKYGRCHTRLLRVSQKSNPGESKLLLIHLSLTPARLSANPFSKESSGNSQRQQPYICEIPTADEQDGRACSAADPSC